MYSKNLTCFCYIFVILCQEEVLLLISKEWTCLDLTVGLKLVSCCSFLCCLMGTNETYFLPFLDGLFYFILLCSQRYVNATPKLIFHFLKNKVKDI